MHADIQKLVEAGKLLSKHGEILSELTPGTWVLHKSWGFGRIDSWNELVGQVVINFQGRKGHSMQFQYAAETLQRVPDEHFLVRKATDREAVRALAERDPAGLVRIVLADHQNKLTVDQIGKLLVPDVMGEAEFKRWWDSAKKVLKKDGHFAVPAKRTEPVILRGEALSRADELTMAFEAARQTKDYMVALDQMVRGLDTFQGRAGELQKVVDRLGEVAAQNQKLQTAAALEIIIGRDDIVTAFPELQVAPGAPSLEKLLRDEDTRMSQVLPLISAARLRRVLAGWPTAFPEQWVEKIVHLVERGGGRVVAEAARLLTDRGMGSRLYEALERAVRERSLSSDGLVWLCKERAEFPDLVNPELLASMLSALERESTGEGRKGGKLHDLLMDDRELLGEMVSEADRDACRDVMRKLMLTTAFDELNKRSLLARVIKVHPEMQTMLTGESEEKEEALVVSWASLEKRKNELVELENKKIPENRRDIQIAREYGDLRENFEYKSAKDQQRVLMRRKTELEIMLNRARGTGFSKPDTSRISIGTVVVVVDPAGSTREQFTILGAWDSDPEHGVISYLTAIGQALLGHPVGDIVQLPAEQGTRDVRIESIVAYQGELLQE